jgi:hypothetical protein
MPYLSWSKTYQSSTFSGTPILRTLAISKDDSMVLVGFSPEFIIASLDLMTGEVLYSGTASSASANYLLPRDGIIHTSTNPFAVYTDTTSG